ncbi:rCG28651 [Rattus norvegicus]|uniref:RCG28651 n=1 Tax=Rattus norvegicus TaxID=10116 RepID=A6HVG3_RAT|nr:rCG28651 [Rattus norvegicus]
MLRGGMSLVVEEMAEDSHLSCFPKLSAAGEQKQLPSLPETCCF